MTAASRGILSRWEWHIVVAMCQRRMLRTVLSFAVANLKMSSMPFLVSVCSPFLMLVSPDFRNR